MITMGGDSNGGWLVRFHMSTVQDSRLNFRLPAELKETIEEAAAHLGQTVTDFAVSTLVQNAREVIEQHKTTYLSHRDWEIFVKMLEDTDAKPNAALASAARRYKRGS
jgi:uncharacterized protein (DUF1778 family)